MDISIRDFDTRGFPAVAVPMSTFEGVLEKSLYDHTKCSTDRLVGVSSHGQSHLQIISKARELDGVRGKVVGMANGMWVEEVFVNTHRFLADPSGLSVTANVMFSSPKSKDPRSQQFTLIGISGAVQETEFVVDSILVGEMGVAPTKPLVKSAFEALRVANAYVMGSARGKQPDYLPGIISSLVPEFGDEAHHELQSVNHLRMTLPLKQPRMVKKAYA